MHIHSIATTAAFFVVLSSLAHAHEEPAVEEDPGPWGGSVSFGYLGTSGNVENSNLNGKFEVSYTSGKWVHTAAGYAINATESGDTTSESYGGSWKSERTLTEPNFVFGLLDYRKDRFSGFPKQFSQTVGYGRRIIDTGTHFLNGEIGAGARQLETADGIDDNGFVVRASALYKWQFSETAAFTQDLIVEAGENNTYLESVTAINARLIGNLALVASYTIKNNSDVPIGIEKTDTFTALALEYSF